MKLFGKIVVLSLMAVALLLWFASRWFDDYLAQPLVVNVDHQEIVVPSGMSYSRLAYRLSKQGFIEYPKLFIAYVRLTNQAAIHVGEYRLTASDNILTLLEKLQSGDVVYRNITIPEGYTAKQMLSRIQQSSFIQSTIDYEELPRIVSELGYGDYKNIEGLFFPDSYAYTRQQTDVEILRMMAKRLNKVLSEEWETRDKGLPYKTPYDALIMASIVEKETGVTYERREIAGVFVRRLDKGMRLQTDPTVIYGMGSRYQGKISRRDLRADTPYNTYTRSGLPPTPIALVGREAIAAALHPADGDSLYFVAKGDGSHQFSATLKEHNRAVVKYQLKRRADYRSHPAQ
ncbi:UPF0755 protein [Sinobacterium caligoides]|uniref:Endolytic murein transglycosylase n=2 Tax=Sinobacterium caligoides TaxID=933926 RepID=A0A3N2DJV2_9GAMM|nr:UPF0755 protein [Sinobacterium caligoides]